MPPPKTLKSRCSEMLFQAFSVAFCLQKSVSWASVEVNFFIVERYCCQVNDHLHLKAFKCCYTYYHNKMRRGM